MVMLRGSAAKPDRELGTRRDEALPANGPRCSGHLWTPHTWRVKRHGFTLIELLVVLTILALLLTIAVPRYFAHVERAKEATLKQDLSVMRDAIDKFHGDKGKYPDSLDDLVGSRYIRNIPIDPVTESTSTWKILPPPEPDAKGAVYDVKSGAEGQGLDGSSYGEW
jgi:general secretion pathway protein G